MAFVVIVLALSLLVGHLAPSWRWILFSAVLGYAIGDAMSWKMLPNLIEVLPVELFIRDAEGELVAPGLIIVAVMSVVATLLVRIIGGIANAFRKRSPHETVVGGVIRRPREELWSIMAPEMTKTHWHPAIEKVERDRMDPTLGHVVYWRKFGGAPARQIRRIEEERPGVQFREVLVDEARSTAGRGMTGGTGWLLEDHPKGTFLTMREEVTGLRWMSLLWRWFDDYERDLFVFLRAHLEGGRDWSLYGLDVVSGVDE